MNPALNKRQDLILGWLDKRPKAPIAEILKLLQGATRITLNRDLKKLRDLGYLVTHGQGRALTYSLSPEHALVHPIDPDVYFKKETDQRSARDRFNFELFSFLDNPFTTAEMDQLNALGKEYEKNRNRFPARLAEQEFERLTIEFSWKSSQIEGNTYSLLETEALIREHREAKGHSKPEARMILNHKETLDYVRKHPGDYKKISVAKIEDLHSLLTHGLSIARGLRKRPVGIVGTRYRPLDNAFQIREALEKACRIVNREKNVFAKTLLVLLLIAYIQPFEDGNKRTSRMTGNAILLAHHLCPLSYRSADETEYKKAVILFYEQNNLTYFKKLFIEQFEFAVKNYFL